jgi:DNA polymerase III subunit gamma/tau
MDYQVSARKWRPRTFEELIGQQHVAQTLTNAISQGRIAHAYLFSGSRGVGKTTMARILAKALNCKIGPTPKPCQSCPACESITAGQSTDVVEIDGASNRGIDEVRELREAVKYTPMQGRYRVYIIDEVHMLTKEAFNALLKTLEEPPAHVVFIMATTEVHKIPSTILSRCQHFQFRRMTRQEIMGQLAQVAQKEGIELTASGRAILAKVADGSMRDALSLLDQSVAYSGRSVTDSDLQAMLGTPNRDILMAMVKALLERQTATALSLIKTVLDQGYDLRQFVGELVEYWRNLLVAKLANEPAALIDLPPEEVTLLTQAANGASEEELQRLFGIFAQALEALRISMHPRFVLEMAVVRATQLPTLQSVEQLLERLEKVEKGLSSGSSLKITHPSPTPDDSQVAQNSAVDPQPVTAEVVPKWEDVIQHVREEKPALASYLEQGTLVHCGENSITLGYPKNIEFLVHLIQKEEHQQIIRGTMKELFGHSVELKLDIIEAKKESRGSEMDTQKQKQTNKEILSHPIVKEALNIFGGEIVDPCGPEER